MIKAAYDLYKRAEKNFQEANTIVETLSSEDKVIFWELQKRNKNVEKVEELVTKQDYKVDSEIVSNQESVLKQTLKTEFLLKTFENSL
jgi:hypothetical protein